MRTQKPAKFPQLVLALLSGLIIAIAVSSKMVSRAASNIDLVLLLALDVSASVDSREYKLMTKGLADALVSDQVVQAIRNGKTGAIAVSVMQWSGFQEQEVKISWRRVSTKADLVALADRIADMPRRYKGGATDIGGALKFSREWVLSAPFSALRKTIDLAGDGANNVNENPSIERDLAVKSGIIINGLAVIGQAVPLVRYYTYFVIGGPAAFVEEARDYDSFGTAMKRKLIREIGGQLLF